MQRIKNLQKRIIIKYYLTTNYYKVINKLKIKNEYLQ